MIMLCEGGSSSAISAAIDGDVDGIVGAIAARLHLRDHQAADRRGLGDGRAGDAAEQRRGGDVDLAEPAAQVADQRAGEGDDAAGDAAAHHQVAGIDEEGDGQQREDAHAGIQSLEDDQRRQAHDRAIVAKLATPRQKAIGVPISISSGEGAEEDREFHAQTSLTSTIGDFLGEIRRPVDVDAGEAQRDPLEREEHDQHAAGDERQVAEAAGEPSDGRSTPRCSCDQLRAVARSCRRRRQRRRGRRSSAAPACCPGQDVEQHVEAEMDSSRARRRRRRGR